MLICFHSDVTFIVWLAAAYLFQHAFKVRVNDVRYFHLFMKVRERHLVFSFFWHNRSGWALQQPFALWFVPFKQVSRFVSVQAAFTEMFALIMPVLVM